jgi:hypothetical protein
MRTGARTHCCSAYLTFVAVAARTAGDFRKCGMPRRSTAGNACARRALLSSTGTNGVTQIHMGAGPMQPLRALPRVVPTQRAHQAIHAEAEVRRQKPSSTKRLHCRGARHAGSFQQQPAAAPGPEHHTSGGCAAGAAGGAAGCPGGGEGEPGAACGAGAHAAAARHPPAGRPDPGARPRGGQHTSRGRPGPRLGQASPSGVFV